MIPKNLSIKSYELEFKYEYTQIVIEYTNDDSIGKYACYQFSYANFECTTDGKIIDLLSCLGKRTELSTEISAKSTYE